MSDGADVRPDSAESPGGAGAGRSCGNAGDAWRRGERRSIDWRGIFDRLVKPAPRGVGLTFAQAAKLTMPQLILVLGVETKSVRPGEIAERLVASQREILDRIAKRRGYLPVELLGLPTMDLIEQIKAESGGHAPVISQLPSILACYVAG